MALPISSEPTQWSLSLQTPSLTQYRKVGFLNRILHFFVAITKVVEKFASNHFCVWYYVAIESEPSPLRREAQSDPA